MPQKATMEKYAPLEETKHDEELIKQGITKAETGFDEPELDSDSSEDKENAENPIDDANFKPDRTLYILRHNLFSKDVNIIDISTEMTARYTGGELTDDVCNAARGLSEDTLRSSNPVYQLKRPHFWNSTFVMTGAASPGTELVSWKHPHRSFGKAQFTFPADSKHGSHNIIMAPTKWYRRTNEWVQDSVTYQWRCNSKLKANRMTLIKKIGNKQIVIGRYAQRWGSWITGGTLLIDSKEIDEVTAVLSACVMLKRMQQRAAERTKCYGGGGGGGGGGE